MHNYVLAYDYQLAQHFEVLEVSRVRQSSFTAGKLKLDTESPYYPSRSDEKIMRDDVIASILSIKKMLSDAVTKGLEISPSTALFVANGAFMDNPEKHLRRIPEVYQSFTPEMSEEEKIRQIFMASPPLLALETLTNGTMSFIAQYTGLKAHNTTFGNTSIASFYALEEAIQTIQNSSAKMALVCACNSGGSYSFLTNSTILGKETGMKESAATANLILKNSVEKPAHALCKITQAKSSLTIPSLGENKIERTWNKLHTDGRSDAIIFSGAYDQLDYESDLAYCKTMSEKTFSFFPICGNVGPANLLAGIIKAIEFINQNAHTVDVFDRDVYGRESLIRLEKC